ncbi:MAG: hypothetical protein ACYSU7_11290, partial [Planctomycetota bacterium]
MPDAIRTALRELDRRKADYGEDAGRRKLELIRSLQGRRLPRAVDVVVFHEALCFLRAYPDNEALLGLVEGVLAGFGDRSDVRKHRQALADSGIAGTSIRFRFFPASALWMARHWGPWLTIDWAEFSGRNKLEPHLEQLALYAETPALDEFGLDIREWIELLKGPEETDAAFVLRRFPQLGMSPFALEMLLEDLDIPLVLSPGPDTPARTREKYDGAPVAYRTSPLRRSRPVLRTEVAQPPAS